MSYAPFGSFWHPEQDPTGVDYQMPGPDQSTVTGPIVTPGDPAPAPSSDPGSDEPYYPPSGGGSPSRGGYPSYPGQGGSAQQASVMGTGMTWFLIAGAVLGVGWLAYDVYKKR